MSQFYTQKSDIEAWLLKCHIYNYSIEENDEYGWVVNCKDNVMIRGKLPEPGIIRVKFNIIAGSFDIGDNSLKSLEGCPVVVQRVFDCANNNLENLSFSPMLVGHDFYCDGNNLNTLKGAPQSVGGGLFCDSNKLTSLEGCPKYVRGRLVCSDNLISTIDFLPEMASSFEGQSNEKLGRLQEITDFKEVQKVRMEFLEIKKNKVELEKAIKTNTKNNVSSVKI